MKKIQILILMVLLVSCASTYDKNLEPSEALNQVLSEKEFTIYSQWAEPQYTAAVSQLSSLGMFGVDNAGGRINIRGNTNYLTVQNDSVMASLPFFGERQMGSSYSNIDQGINFRGIPEDFETEQEGSIYKVSFSIRDSNSRSEKYDVRIRITSKLKSTINITSTHRFSIRYQGNVEKADNNTKNLN